MLPATTLTGYQAIKESLFALYLDDPRPWLAGFSGGNDGTKVASLVFDAVPSIPPDHCAKPVAILWKKSSSLGPAARD